MINDPQDTDPNTLERDDTVIAAALRRSLIVLVLLLIEVADGFVGECVSQLFSPLRFVLLRTHRERSVGGVQIRGHLSGQLSRLTLPMEKVGDSFRHLADGCEKRKLIRRDCRGFAPLVKQNGVHGPISDGLELRFGRRREEHGQ